MDASDEAVEPMETAPIVPPLVEANAPNEPNNQTPACRPYLANNPAAQPPAKPAATKRLYDLAPPANGEDVLQLDLPDQVEVSQLLDLAAEYLHIDYMYEPESIRGQSVSLRLHGKLQGDIRVKDLYPLLESVLKFKGFAMTRHKDNLVTIVPMAEALQADPTLMDPNGTIPRSGRHGRHAGLHSPVRQSDQRDEPAGEHEDQRGRLGRRGDPLPDRHLLRAPDGAHRAIAPHGGSPGPAEGIPLPRAPAHHGRRAGGKSETPRGRDADRRGRNRFRGAGSRHVRPGGGRVSARALSRPSRTRGQRLWRFHGAPHGLPRCRRKDQSHPDGRLCGTVGGRGGGHRRLGCGSAGPADLHHLRDHSTWTPKR